MSSADIETRACDDLTDAINNLVERQGYRLDEIFPADAPRVAILSRDGARLRLDCDTVTRYESAPANDIILAHHGDDAWSSGRAGMQYRDLIPGRLGGECIASNIRIPTGGPVPDYVHHHDIRFQLIYCLNGWVRLVYEDQGEPFVMRAGDCVLQPPHIRHRVLECSDGFEVVEVASPAEHPTFVEHDMTLPTGRSLPDRDFGGQRFVFHEADAADWQNLHGETFRDLGLLDASAGAISARVLRPTGANCELASESAWVFAFVLGGSARLGNESVQHAVGVGDAVTIPAGLRCRLSAAAELEILEIRSGGE